MHSLSTCQLRNGIPNNFKFHLISQVLILKILYEIIFPTLRKFFSVCESSFMKLKGIFKMSVGENERRKLSHAREFFSHFLKHDYSCLEKQTFCKCQWNAVTSWLLHHDQEKISKRIIAIMMIMINFVTYRTRFASLRSKKLTGQQE